MDTVDRLMIPDVAGQAIRRVATQCEKHVVYTASTIALGNVPCFYAPTALTVASVYYIAATASSATAGTSSQNLILTKYTGTVGTGATFCSATVSAGTPLVAEVPFSLGTITGASMAAGNRLDFSTALTGTATIPAGMLAILYTVD